MNALGFACVVAFGRVGGGPAARPRPGHRHDHPGGGAAAAIYWAKPSPTPALVATHVVATPNMEGKEVRFGAASTRCSRP